MAGAEAIVKMEPDLNKDQSQSELKLVPKLKVQLSLLSRVGAKAVTQ